MTDDNPTPADKNEKSDRFRRILSQPEDDSQPLLDDFDVPEPAPIEGAAPQTGLAEGETLIFDMDEPDPSRVVGTDTLPLQNAQPDSPSPQASDTQPMRVQRPPAPSQQGPAGYRPTGSGNTPPPGGPALDANGMPLPRRVDEIDMDATRVSPVAYNRARQESASAAPPPAAQTALHTTAQRPEPLQRPHREHQLRCLYQRGPSRMRLTGAEASVAPCAWRSQACLSSSS